MKLHRFLGNFDLSGESARLLDEELLNQLRNVLRLKAGDEIILNDGRLNEAIARISVLEKDFADVQILRAAANQTEPEREVVLYCAILKKENFELVVQKATEIGIKEICPIITKRTVKLDLNYERLEKIIKESVEQCGRGYLPVLRRAVKFEEAILEAKNNDANIIFCAPVDPLIMPTAQEQNGSFSPIRSLSDKLRSKKRAGIFIGPEGGWDENEIILAKENGFESASLGRLTLRAETAAIAASYLTCNLD